MTQLPPRHKELTVGQLSARSGVSVSALHFYESKSLIRSRRTSGNQRRYSRDTLRRVAFIRASQRVGIPLSTIREALAGLPEGRTPNSRDWAELSTRWRAELETRIDQLLRLRDALSECIGCGCLSLEHCVLSNPDDRMGGLGPGSLVLSPPPATTEGGLDREIGQKVSCETVYQAAVRAGTCAAPAGDTPATCTVPPRGTAARGAAPAQDTAGPARPAHPQA